MGDLKERVCQAVDDIAAMLIEVSAAIHEHPELKFEETFASELLAGKLTEVGFETQLGVAGLDTAIAATHPGRSPGRTVAILGEYDALPEIGHACGHNLIAAAALGACTALASVKHELPGTLVFYGTPAEEGGGGKVLMIEAGLFKDVDVAMMFHPAANTMVDRGSLAITEVHIEFTGKPSHASGSPERGINALDAVIQTFNGINALRQHIKDGARIHGIIDNGGAKPNIVPEFASAVFYVRAREAGYRDELLDKLRHCAEGAALATGASLAFTLVGHSYKPMKPNRVLGERFAAHLENLGEPLSPPKDRSLGSTDMGDVSQVVPAIHPYIRICEEEVAGHSRQFTEASISDRGHRAMLVAAKALALTAIDIWTDDALAKHIAEEFATT
ncbi:MAG: M20 family metallopeptidase [Candidatus Bipolaricaulota bacterium]|nr:MAG: M20 family metallopeptidase [Candidatus Bipolaricaulota bacterium]